MGHLFVPPCPPALRLRSTSFEASASPQKAAQLLIRNYLEGLHDRRLPYSQQRISASLLAAIAWADRNARGARDGEVQRIMTDVSEFLEDASYREDLSEDGMPHILANEITNAHRHVANNGRPSATAITLAETVLKTLKLETVDAANLLQEMESSVPSFADDALIDPHYCYALTAWANLGAPDEISARAEAAKAIFSNPFRTDLSSFGLKCLPVLPDTVERLDVSNNELTDLLGVPPSVSLLLAHETPVLTLTEQS